MVREFIMSNAKTTIIKHIGSIQGYGGAISVSYEPDRGSVYVYAYNPRDRRKASFLVSLTNAEFQNLKALLDTVEFEIETESLKRTPSQTTTVKQRTSPSRTVRPQTSQYPTAEAANSGQFEDDFVVISLTDSSISLPSNLFERASALITEGKTILAASLICKSLSSLSLADAKKVALAICESQQARGVRQ